MKKLIVLICLIGTIGLSACATPAQKQTNQPMDNPSVDQLSATDEIMELVAKGTKVEEVSNPNLTLPSDINSGQIQKYFKISDYYLALVMTTSMNIFLTLPANFKPTFTGALIAKPGDKQWIKLLEIKDTKPNVINNPYYLFSKNNELLLTVVDQQGAGSGEGNMKVFALMENNNWDIIGCYYFGGNYKDGTIDGDGQAYSAKFELQSEQTLELCSNVQIIPQTIK